MYYMIIPSTLQKLILDALSSVHLHPSYDLTLGYRHAIDSVFGCVTTGALWKFLRLENQTLYIDRVEIPLEPIERLLGIFSLVIK